MMSAAATIQHAVIIVGGGLVGASLALALRKDGIDAALIEPRTSGFSAETDDWDQRVYAISPGNAGFLRQLGVWERLPPQRLQRVEAMKIYGDRAQGQLEFNAYDAGLLELAWIVENRSLQQAFSTAMGDAFSPQQAARIVVDTDAARITLADGAVWSAQLVVGADGADSRVRRETGLTASVSDYRQTGVVANFECAKPHRDTAFQWFRHDGVLALLPLPGNRVSMVWSTGEAHGRELLALDAQSLAEKVSCASAGVVGDLRVITPAAGFPLRRSQAARIVAHRVALVGDAAHCVHPLAGQGVNLGFRDVRELTRVLSGRAPRQDCGELSLLRRYERGRREDVAAMVWGTDGLQKLFAAQPVWVSAMRNFGLAGVNKLAPLKNFLIREAAA